METRPAGYALIISGLSFRRVQRRHTTLDARYLSKKLENDSVVKAKVPPSFLRAKSRRALISEEACPKLMNGFIRRTLSRG